MAHLGIGKGASTYPTDGFFFLLLSMIIGSYLDAAGASHQVSSTYSMAKTLIIDKSGCSRHGGMKQISLTRVDPS